MTGTRGLLRAAGARLRALSARLEHPFVALLAVALFVWCCADGVGIAVEPRLGPSLVTLAFVLAEAAALAAAARRPRVGCWMLGAVFLSSWIGYFSGVFNYVPDEITFTFYFSIALLAYFHFADALLLDAALSVGTALLLVYDFFPDVIVLLAVGFACAMIGVGARFITRKVRERYARRHHRENLLVAARLHDHVCNDLAVLLLETAQDPDFAKLPRAGEYTALLRHAMSQTREAITLLDDKNDKKEDADRRTTPRAAPTKGKAPGTSLTELVDGHRKKLESLGFTGVVRVNVDDRQFLADTPAARLAADTVSELFGNIAKHAAPAGGYVLSLTASNGALTISLADTPTTADTTDSINDNGGHTGLRRLRERIADAGGSLDVDSTPGHWSLRAKIPMIAV